MIYPALRKWLLDDSNIAAAVSNRIWPVKVPQKGQTPAIVITRISGQRAPILDGPSPLAHVRFQVDSWVQELPGISAFEQARALGDLVRARLEAYSGELVDPSTSPARSVRVWIHFDQERDLFETDVSGGFFRTSQDYLIWHRTRVD
jgi:hypothetical protein